MNKKAQFVIIDFLWRHLISMLVICIAFSGIMSWLYFERDNFANEKSMVSMPTGLYLMDYAVNDNRLDLVVVNNLGSDLDYLKAKFPLMDAHNAFYFKSDSGSRSIANGEKARLSIEYNGGGLDYVTGFSVLNFDRKALTTLVLEYKNSYSGLVHYFGTTDFPVTECGIGCPPGFSCNASVCVNDSLICTPAYVDLTPWSDWVNGSCSSGVMNQTRTKTVNDTGCGGGTRILTDVQTIGCGPATTINSCTSILTPGNYELGSDLSNPGGSCLFINSSDINMDCKSHTITGMPALDFGITSFGPFDNIHLENCHLISSDIILDARNGVFKNFIIDSNDLAVHTLLLGWVTSSQFTNFTLNDFYFKCNLLGGTVLNNFFISITHSFNEFGMRCNGYENAFNNIYIDGNNMVDYGIKQSGSGGNLHASNITIKNTRTAGVYLEGGSDNILDFINLSNTGVGILVEQHDPSSSINNVITHSTSCGLSADLKCVFPGVLSSDYHYPTGFGNSFDTVTGCNWNGTANYQYCNGTSPSPTNLISSCPYTINSPGNYELQNNVSSAGSCIIINASLVTLDCKGYSITGTQSIYFPYLPFIQIDTQIKNCEIFEYAGITLPNFAQSTSFDNILFEAKGDIAYIAEVNSINSRYTNMRMVNSNLNLGAGCTLDNISMTYSPSGSTILYSIGTGLGSYNLRNIQIYGNNRVQTGINIINPYRDSFLQNIMIKDTTNYGIHATNNNNFVNTLDAINLTNTQGIRIEGNAGTFAITNSKSCDAPEDLQCDNTGTMVINGHENVFNNVNCAGWGSANYQYCNGSSPAPTTNLISSCTSAPFVISAEGTYELSNNLASAGNCIFINASHITLDCKGFSITGASSIIFGGSQISHSVEDVNIKNCDIFEGSGISVGMNNLFITFDNIFLKGTTGTGASVTTVATYQVTFKNMQTTNIYFNLGALSSLENIIMNYNVATAFAINAQIPSIYDLEDISINGANLTNTGIILPSPYVGSTFKNIAIRDTTGYGIDAQSQGNYARVLENINLSNTKGISVQSTHPNPGTYSIINSKSCGPDTDLTCSGIAVTGSGNSFNNVGTSCNWGAENYSVCPP